MKNIISIAKRELLSFFVSPLAYFVITGFVVVSGFFFTVLLAFFGQAMEQYRQMAGLGMGGVAPNLNSVVVQQLYGTMIVVLVFLVPLLTMRTVAEDKKNGTFELLITSPVSVFEIVIGKYLGVSITLLIMILGMFLYPLLLMVFSSPAPEFLPMLSGLLAIIFCALAFASIGMAVSSYSDNQMVAGVSSMVALLLLYVIHAPAQSIGGTTGDVLSYLSPIVQAKDMLKGVITTQSVVYFVSTIAFGLFLSQRILDSARWR